MRIEDTIRLTPGVRVVSAYSVPPYRPCVVHSAHLNKLRTRCLVTVRLGEGFRTFPHEMIDWPPDRAAWNPDRLAWCDHAGEQVLPQLSKEAGA